MKNILRHSVLTALLAFSVGAHANPNPALQGKWEATKAEGKALAGVIELRKDGSATLAPAGEEALTGTWQAKGSRLELTMPPYGTSSMQYRLNKKVLTLSYENGEKQHFTKVAK